MTSRRTSLIKMFAAGAICVIGGPLLVEYLRPTEEELFQKFNPELQRRHLELKEQRQKDFEEFVQQMKEHSKSDKSIWDAYKDSEKKRLREYEEKRRAELAAQAAQKEEIQRELASKS